MDDELLIEVIRLRPVIYNSAHSKYMDNKLKDNLWKEISQILKEEVSACKSRWNNMRDNYRKSLKKISAGSKTKRYKYSDQLSFLNNCFQEKESPGSIDDQDDVIDTVTKTQVIKDEHEIATPPVIEETDDEQDSPRPPKIRKVLLKRKSQNPEGVRKYIVNKNSQLPVTQKFIHPVDAFLAGIAPTLKSLTPYFLNLAKSEIFTTVQEYEMAMLTQQGKITSDRSEPALSPSSPNHRSTPE